MSSRAARLRHLLHAPDLAFVMEAHNGLSARIVEEAGFDAIWAGSLSIAAALGVRDCNEASWTQESGLSFSGLVRRCPRGHGRSGDRRSAQCVLDQVLTERRYPSTQRLAVHAVTNATAPVATASPRRRGRPASRSSRSCPAMHAAAIPDATLRGARVKGQNRRMVAAETIAPNAMTTAMRTGALRGPPGAVPQESRCRASIYALRLPRCSLRARGIGSDPRTERVPRPRAQEVLS